MAAAQVGSNKGFGDERYRQLIDQLISARQKHGMSQAALASRLGQVQQFVSRYETGERRLDIVEFVDVARSLGLDVNAMLITIRTRGE